MARSPAALVGAFLFSALSASAANEGNTPLRVTALPAWLDAGWESADAEPGTTVAEAERLAWRPATPDRDAARRGGIRWYRLRLDVTAVANETLALRFGRIRDVDRAYWNGVPIGGAGRFPPAAVKANYIERTYLVPQRLVGAGAGTLLLEVWHGPRPGPAFAGVPVLESAVAAFRHQSLRDQQALVLFCLALSLAVVLTVFALRVPHEAYFRQFGFALLSLGAYFAAFHSAAASFPLGTEWPLLVSQVATGLVGAFYVPALAGAVKVRPPRRLRHYRAFYFVYAASAALFGRLDAFYPATRLFFLVTFVSFFDLLVLLVRAVRERAPNAIGFFAGHVAFTLGLVFLSLDVLLRARFGLDPYAAGVALQWAGFLLSAGTLVWAVGARAGHYRLAAATDAGTGLWNRKALVEEIRRRAERASRPGGHGMALVLVDLDRFKEWNDAEGHLAGDRLLESVARSLQRNSRPTDVVARYGGDEFAILLDLEGNESSAPVAASRIRTGVAAVCRAETGEVGVSASAGVALWDARRCREPEDLIRDADRALYAAKRAGRDATHVFRVSLSGERPVPLAG